MRGTGRSDYRDLPAIQSPHYPLLLSCCASVIGFLNISFLALGRNRLVDCLVMVFDLYLFTTLLIETLSPSLFL
jgi:hypothetical protein